MLLCSIFMFPSEMSAARPKQVLKRGQMGIVAHRGFWNCEEAGFARNSVAALRCAQENGFWGSEFDVNMTSDGVLLVFHDGKVDGKKIEKHTHSDFEYYTLENGEKIPTIDQYLEQGKKYPETMLVYEMKPHSSNEVEDRFVELTIAKLKEHDLLDPDRVMFISFSYYLCERMAEELPGFTVQYLGGERNPSKVKKDGINGIDYHFKVFDVHKKWASQARRLKMTTNAWTVNKEEKMRDVIAHGVMYMTTDYPLDARKIMEEEDVTEVR